MVSTAGPGLPSERSQCTPGFTSGGSQIHKNRSIEEKIHKILPIGTVEAIFKDFERTKSTCTIQSTEQKKPAWGAFF